MQVTAEDVEEAFDLGVSAVEHLLDTFNDNETIHPLIKIEAYLEKVH
jgi:hypothetical protein